MSSLAILAQCVLTAGERHESFFSYSDCHASCQTAHLSCTIMEINPTYFSCECRQSEGVCEMEATPDVVCIREGKEVLGGSAIWNDFQKYKFPTTTTARPPNPSPSPNQHSAALAWSLSILGMVVTTPLAFYLLRLRLRRRMYRQISSERELYLSTTEDI